jgi:hypothetical protein
MDHPEGVSLDRGDLGGFDCHVGKSSVARSSAQTSVY